jgi:hypothetical protein
MNTYLLSFCFANPGVTKSSVALIMSEPNGKVSQN